MTRLIILFIFFAFIFFSTPAYPQSTGDSTFTDTTTITEVAVKPATSDKITDRFMSTDELRLSYAVLIFATIVLLLEVFLVSINKVNPENSFKFIIVTLIVGSSLFLITAGYNNNQIAPAFGLFGTIAGYILGKATSQDVKKDQNENKNI